MTHQTFPKSRPKLLQKREARAQIAAIDRAENVIVRRRSCGQCELYEAIQLLGFSAREGAFVVTSKRCKRRATPIHHLISGIGRRNRGESIKAEHKLHLCDRCHLEIHGHVLVPENAVDRYDAATVRYERVR